MYRTCYDIVSLHVPIYCYMNKLVVMGKKKENNCSCRLSSLQVGLMRNGNLLAESPPEALMKMHSATVSTLMGHPEEGTGIVQQQQEQCC